MVETVSGTPVGATTRQTMADRPVTRNTCNNGGKLRILPLQVGRDSLETACNPVFEGESHAFCQLFSEFRKLVFGRLAGTLKRLSAMSRGSLIIAPVINRLRLSFYQ